MRSRATRSDIYAADPAGGPGTQTVHDVKNYSVQTLDRLVLRLVGEEMARLTRS